MKPCQIILVLSNIENSHIAVFVTKLLRNGWSYFYEILCVYLIGLRINPRLFFISLNDKGVYIPKYIFIYTS